MTRFWGNCGANSKNNPACFSAFTLAEMMVVMLILSIVLAAMAPVMTTRNKPNNSSPWQYEANNRNNAWFGAGAAQEAMIGQRQKRTGDIATKLQITLGSGDTTTSLLAFKRGDTQLGRLYMNNDGGLMFGSTTGVLGSNSNAVGRQVEANASNSTAFGSVAKANGDNSTAVGSTVTASGNNSVSIGTSTTAKADSSVAIGNSAFTAGADTVVIGNNANIKYSSGNRLAVSTNQSEGSIIIGKASSTLSTDNISSKGVIVIGNNAKIDEPISAVGAGAIAIGESATAQYMGSIALGRSAKANGYYTKTASLPNGLASSIAIGDNAQSLTYRAIAIGNNAQIPYQSASPNAESIAIGYNAIAQPKYGYATVIGSDSKSAGDYSVALGYKTNNPYNGTSSNYYWSNESGGYSIKSNETYTAGNSSIAIGNNSYAKGANSVAIGSMDSFYPSSTASWRKFFTYTEGASSVAIGAGAQSKGGAGIALGSGAAAIGSNSIAIGTGAKARANNSVAIGNGVSNSREYVIQLGDANTTVYIPGNLVVGKYTYLGDSRQVNQDGYNHFMPLMIKVGRQGGGDWGYHQVKTISGDWGTNNDKINLKFEQGGSTGPFDSTTSSDRRLKYVGKENLSGLDKIRQLKVFNYTYKKDTTKTPHVGVIAQDLQKVFPNAVKKGADGFLTIRMEDMFYAVINAIKELDAKYQVQEKRITALEQENKEFKARLERLEAKTK